MTPSPEAIFPSGTEWLYKETLTPSGYHVPHFITQLHAFWPDLETVRNAHMHTEEGLVNMLAFWENPLRHHSPDIVWPVAGVYPGVLLEPQDGVEQDAVLPITKGIMGAMRVRTDLGHFSTDSRLGRLQIMHWRLFQGSQEYGYLRLTEDELRLLEAPSTAFRGAIGHLPRLAEFLPVHCADRADLVSLLLQGDRATYEDLWQVIGPGLRGMLARAPRYDTSATVNPPPTLGTFEPDGVNVVGFARGQFGIGEHARLATRALLKAEIPTVVIDSPIPLDCVVFRDGWINDHIRPQPQYRVNIIVMPAADTLRMFFQQKVGILAGRYNICYWQWELPRWPETWRKLLAIPDEIWAFSRYVKSMFEASTDKPVIYMPLAVELSGFLPRPRARFKIPDGKFAFLSVFDCNSWYRRKNAMGSIKAFQLAFPGNRDVQLVVKMMYAQADHQEYKELMRLAALDPRVHVIDECLSRSDMWALLNAVDVFVSLHRAEGFGCVVAESMLLGKPVISTNFSGSLDFAHSGTAYVVDGPMVPLKKGDYAEYEGQHWMDPDIGMAAEAMRRCVEDPEATHAMALRGRDFVLQNHSVEAVSRLCRQRLGGLMDLGG